jgi:hypothetical protein
MHPAEATPTDPRPALRVSEDLLPDLIADDLVQLVPRLRGVGADAIVAIGTNAAAVVTLLQTPDTLRALAAWLRRRAERDMTVIRISARSRSRQLDLDVRGDIEVETVAAFLRDAFSEPPCG